MKKGFTLAFTLAEVLITLGIIGIVAALTIPTLIANTQGAGNRSKFKKAVSTLDQVGRMSLVKNGYSYGDVNDMCNATDYCSDAKMSDGSSDSQSICKIMETGLSAVSYLGLAAYDIDTRVTVSSHSSFTFGYYLLSDGAVVGVSLGGGPFCTVKSGSLDSKWINDHDVSYTTSSCFGFIDVNGPNGPNKEVKCSNGIETTTEVEKPCKVDTKDITDVFPIVFHDATVEPASNAAMYVLKTAK